MGFDLTGDYFRTVYPPRDGERWLDYLIWDPVEDSFYEAQDKIRSNS